MQRCAGAVALVTGGGRGIGLVLARGLASEGAAVALVDVLPETADVATALGREFGVPAVGVVADVTDASAVQAAFDTVTAQLGTPTVLVTSAGITSWGPSVDVDPAEWQRVMDINLSGTFFACQSFARGLLRDGRPGSAILISSMSAQIVNIPQAQASYNSSKAAVSHLARSLAVEWARDGIRVNAIGPGYTLSDMTRQFMDANPELRLQWESLVPMGRLGVPEDLVGMTVLLASEESSYLTGQTLVIDGGYTLL